MCACVSVCTSAGKKRQTGDELMRCSSEVSTHCVTQTLTQHCWQHVACSVYVHYFRVCPGREKKFVASRSLSDSRPPYQQLLRYLGYLKLTLVILDNNWYDAGYRLSVHSLLTDTESEP